ncbi:dehydrodolichyl diphosphate synthase complex subunit nus1-like isoform X2 [Halichondria panicea]|uniref:dehydrodolichyl diphosphate synthase complex subunit nus1-like isoform X2 n=1 Tax=Halichondria panicea TaxID=6063 RepID=UPI00312B82C5
MGVTEGLLSFTLSTLHYSRMFKIYVGYALGWLWTSMLFVLKHKGTKLEAIQEDANTLNKIPLHIAILVNSREEQLNLDDLARLVVWALASGINTVSLYSPNDTLNEKLITLRQCIVRHHQVMFSPPVPLVEVTELPQLSASSCPGHTVLVLSPKDGRQRLTELARKLSTSVLKRQIRVTDVDCHLLTDKLVLSSNIPDPDLALVCGGTSSTLGFPPWQLRLTEIQTLQGHGKVTYQDFFQSLQRFAKCQQRYGK